MTGALRAEWTKLRTAGGTLWLLLAAVVVIAGIGAAVTAGVHYPPFGTITDTTKLSLTGVLVGQGVVAILGVLAASSEYSFGTIHLTLLAIPRRRRVLVAKATVVGVLVAAAGVVAVLVSLLVGRSILGANGYTPAHGYPLVSLAHSRTMRAAVGSVLYLVLVSLVGVGAAMAVRDTAAAIGAVLGVLFLFPILAGLASSPHWQRHLLQIGPMAAGLNVQATVNLRSLAIGPWAGLGVLGLWAAGALALGGFLLRVRDA